MNDDVLVDLRWHRKELDKLKTANGFSCECDPSVGYDPCPICFEKVMVDRAIREIESLREMRDCLKWVENETCSLQCENIPTGGDDYDVGWRVVSHHMDKPNDRVIGLGRNIVEAVASAKQGELE